LPFSDGFFIGKGLKDIGPQHSGAAIGETMKIVNEAVFFSFSLCIQEYLKFKDGLRLYN
jgi:hypothetical protein